MRASLISTTRRTSVALLVFLSSVSIVRAAGAQTAPEAAAPPDAGAASPATVEPSVPAAPDAPFASSPDAATPAVPAPDAGTTLPTQPAAPAPFAELPPAPFAELPPVPPAVAPDAAAPKADAHHKPHSPLVPDADIRQHKTKPIAPNAAFKPGDGITFSSVDGDFKIAMRLRAQILASFESEHSGKEETLVGATIRRARLAFQGNVFGKHNKYKFELAVSPRDEATKATGVGTAPLLDAYMTFDYLKEATLVVGQYKVPFSRQRVVSSRSLQMVDRSIVQGEFNLDRNVGLDVRSKSLLGGHFHYYAGIYGGEGRNAFELKDNSVVYLARAEVLPFGKYDDYVEADFERTGPRLSIAGSFAHLSNSSRDRGPLGSAPDDGGTTTFNTAEGDILLKMYGLSVTSELFWREGDRDAGTAVDENNVPVPIERPRDGYGGFGQFGYLLPHTMFEITGRYGNMRRSGAKSSLKNQGELGGGVSYYFARHSLKLQGDYFRLWQSDRVSDGADSVRVQLEAGF